MTRRTRWWTRSVACTACKASTSSTEAFCRDRAASIRRSPFMPGRSASPTSSSNRREYGNDWRRPTRSRKDPPGEPAAGKRELAAVGTLSLRAGVGIRARRLQPRRRGLGLSLPRSGALAGLSLERRRSRRRQRRSAASLLCPGSVERPRSHPEGARLRIDRRAGQPRRGREGILLLSRRHADPQSAALPLQVSAERFSLWRARGGKRAAQPQRPALQSAKYRGV